MQKKVLISILLIIVVVVLAYVYILRNTNDEVCNPYENTKDINSCNCLKEATLITQCKANITGTDYFTAALEKSDLSLCNKISNLGVKDSCMKIVQGKIDFDKKSSEANLLATSTKQK